MTTQEVLNAGRPSALAGSTAGSASPDRPRFGRWRRAVSLFAAAAAVASAGLVAGSATPRHAKALDPIVCQSGSLLAAKPDGIYLADKDTGATTPLITSAQIPGLTVVNQVGVSLPGPDQMIIFTAIINGVQSVVRYNVLTGESTVAAGPGGVAGGVNLNNGLFYFGSAGGGSVPGHAILNVLDPVSGVVTLGVLDITLPDGYGGNGDVTFDSAGNLYLVSADGANYHLYRVSGPIPATGTNQLTATQISTSIGGPSEGAAGGINGIAFGSDSFLYASGGSNLRQFNPVTGKVVDTVALPSATDLGTCADPNRVRLYKNLPVGRVAPTDQFSLKLDGSAPLGNTATTTGTASGLQDQSTSVYIGPLIALADTPITISETPAPGSTTVPSNYLTTWTCVDESQGNLVVGSGNGSTGTFLVPKTYGVNINCQFFNIPKGSLTVQKDLPSGRVLPGDQFTMSISPGDAPSATTTGTKPGIQAETSTLALATPGVPYTISEAAAGTTVLANYVSTWKCVDTANGNLPVASGSGVTGTVVMPNPGGPALTKVVCTFTNMPVLSTVKPSKSVSPPDGSTVLPGETVTYTLTFDNSAGPTPAATNYVDDLAGVLDDATVTAAPTLTSGTGLTVSAVANGKFTIDGAVPAGTTAVVTYKAVVKPDGGRGDNQLLNFLLKPSTPTPTTCAVGDPLCTVNPVPQLAVTKSVTPADGSAVAAGQPLTYTITFSNALGKAPAPVKWSDNIAGVLDDATLTSGPTSSDPALTPSAVASGAFDVTGSVAPGATVTVTYQVLVKPDGQRGDNDLLNFVFRTGTTPPTTCAVGDPLCTENPIPKLLVTKSVDPADGSAVVAGQVLTYTLKYDNSMGKAPATVDWTDDITGVLDDATVTSPPASSNASLVASAVTAGKFTVKGTVAAGSTVTVTYKVQVKPDAQRGDNLLANFLAPTGTTPPTTCAVGDPLCTANPVPKLVVAKSVDPADGSAVVAGQVLTYTLTFDNAAGKAPATVDWTDDITGVLDDATIVATPVTSNPSLTASAVTAGKFTVKGSVAAGSTVTVTYKVQVKPDGHRGNNVLANFVVPTGTTPPATCAVGDPLCTENKVPNLLVSKSVDPADGTTVLTGQTLTYTLTFDNSSGKAAAPINWNDFIAGVLDDATLTSGPTSSDPSVTAEAPSARGVIKITGSVNAGAKVTVTYKVLVKADEARGDNRLMNFLVPIGTEPPTVCVVGDPMCTENPVPELVVSKAVDPADGSKVVAGQTLTYTLKFDNSVGKAPATVKWTDDMTGVLDDATIVAAPTASNPSLTTSAITAGKFTITGTVGAGAVVTVTYKVQVKPNDQRVDSEVLNFLMPTGTVPPTKCFVGDPLCTVNLVPKLIVTKSADPADGTIVVAGNTVTYTLTFDNTTGKAAADVDWSDDISGVLDDATLTSAPAPSDPSLVASSPSPRGLFQVRGSVAAGSKVTVTYKVQVKQIGDRTDNVLLNFVFPTGTQPPITCAAGDPLCTEHPIPELVVNKSVNPADASTVTVGQSLTYTLKFSNARGKAPAVVAVDDNLSKVLDDATVTSAPTSTNAALVVTPISGGVFTIRGTLAPGQTAEVSMKVQVNADGARGDNDLLNFIVEPGKPLPDACAAGDPLCTENPVPTAPAILLDKTVASVVDTGGDGLNTPGDIVTFGFKVTNNGNVPLTDIVLSDPFLGAAPLTCPKKTLQPGESMDCTGPKYTLTNADLAAARVTNVATVTGKPPTGPSVNSTDNVVVPVNSPPVIPSTGGNMPGRIVRIAPPLMVVGFGLLLLAKRRRSRLATRI